MGFDRFSPITVRLSDGAMMDIPKVDWDMNELGFWYVEDDKTILIPWSAISRLIQRD